MIDVLLDDGGVGASLARRIEEAVQATLVSEGVAEAELSLALVDDATIQGLNRDHLGLDRTTDVIAFSLWEEGQPVVGDVYVGLEQARRQAEEEGVPADEELVRLAIHGTLHVLGWDHPEDAEAREVSPMYRRQEELVARLGGPHGQEGP